MGPVVRSFRARCKRIESRNDEAPSGRSGGRGLRGPDRIDQRTLGPARPDKEQKRESTEQKLGAREAQFVSMNGRVHGLVLVYGPARVKLEPRSPVADDHKRAARGVWRAVASVRSVPRPTQPIPERSIRLPQRLRTARRVAGTRSRVGSASVSARAASRATATNKVSRNRSAIRSSGR